MGACLIVCDLVPSKMRQPRPESDYCITGKSLCNVKKIWLCMEIFCFFWLDDGI
jgi:hypothetical protein